MARWFIATKERRAQVLDIAADGTPSAVYNSQLVPGGSAQFWSCWSPDGGTTIYLGGREWGGDSACLWKSINGGLAWVDAAGDAGSPGELPTGFHGDNCRIRSMYGIVDGLFYAQCEGAGVGNDWMFKWEAGVWSKIRAAEPQGQGASQMHISPAGFFMGTKFTGWQPVGLADPPGWGWDNFFTGAVGKRPIGVWYLPNIDDWIVINMNGSLPEAWRGDPYVPSGPSNAGTGTWVIEHSFTGKTRTLDDGSNVLWGDGDGNLYTVLDAGTDCEVWKRDKDTGIWSLDYTLTGVGNYAGGIWGAGDEILACATSASAEQAAFRTADGVWSLINLSTLFGIGADNGQGIWAAPGQSIDSVVGPDGTARVTTKGGDVMTATGSFTELATMRAYFGLAGDDTDTPCYFGFGLGYDAGYSEDGETVQIIAPPHSKTSSAILTIVVDGDTLNFGPIEVAERSWPGKLHTMRKNFAPWQAVGARHLESEDLE